MFQRLSVRAALAVGLACLSLPVAAQQTVPVPQMNQTQVYQAWTSMGRTADLSVTTGSGATPTSLGIAAPVARVCNVGATNAAYVRLGTPATVVTLLNGSVIAPGACLAMNAQGATSAVAITASSTTTVQIELGTGTPYSSLAPGSGAGSGVTSFNTRTGAVTSQAGDYTTAIVAEVTNLYFTNARAIAAPLTGYVSGAGVVAATDSVLQAIQKLNGNITALSCSQVANAACVNAANVFTAAQTVNLNAASAPTAITGTALQVVAADSVTARVEINSFGAIAAVSLARADGTAASPTGVLSGEQIGGFNGYSYVTSASPGYVGPVASVQILATQNHTTTAMGSKVQIGTIPNNSTTLTTGLTVDQDQSVTAVGSVTGASFIPSGSSVPTNGMYLSAANTVNFSTNTTNRLTLSTTLNIAVAITGNSAGAQVQQTASSATAPVFIPNRNDTTTGIGAQASGNISLIIGGAEIARVSSGGLTLETNGSVLAFRTGNTIISSPATASVQLGNADVDTNASIVAQTLRSQGALAGGTSNQAGANLTLIVSPGKGTGAGGSFIVQTAPAGSTGTSVNAPVTALTIASTGLSTFAFPARLSTGYTVAGLPTAGTAGRFAYVTDQLTTCAAAGAVLTGGGAVVCPVFDNGVAWVGG